MKFCTAIAFLTAAAATGIASASPTLDQRNHNSGLKHTELPYGMKSPPDCKKWKSYCLGCNEEWVVSPCKSHASATPLLPCCPLHQPYAGTWIRQTGRYFGARMFVSKMDVG